MPHAESDGLIVSRGRRSANLANPANGTPVGPGGTPTGLVAPFLLFLVVTLGWFLFLFRRRRRPDGGAPSRGAATLVAVGADGGPMFAVPLPPQPGPRSPCRPR